MDDGHHTASIPPTALSERVPTIKERDQGGSIIHYYPAFLPSSKSVGVGDSFVLFDFYSLNDPSSLSAQVGLGLVLHPR